MNLMKVALSILVTVQNVHVCCVCISKRRQIALYMINGRHDFEVSTEFFTIGYASGVTLEDMVRVRVAAYKPHHSVNCQIYPLSVLHLL